MNYSPGLNTGTNSINTVEQTGLVPKIFDYIAADYSGATFDVYTYKSGGIVGTTVATVTITWTDATKATLATVVRT